MKKRLSLLLAIVLVLGSFSSVFAAPFLGPERLEGIDIVSEKDDNEEIRVIVELVDEPAIAHASGKYTDLPESTRNRIERDILAAQEAVKNDLSRRGITMDYINSFSVAFNGFSGTVKKYDIEAIKENPNVKNVYISNKYERPIVTPDMGSSYEMIGNREIWGPDGYNGEGMVVAIIDTGIDPGHPDMTITDADKVKIKEADLAGTDLPGKYYKAKVPYGYNYFDRNHTIIDTDPDPHGMHVAGTVAANGKIKGVAPEAQLLAMKVFSNDPDFPSTYDDVYMAAIEDAIKLGVDVVNMSLGASASFYIPDNPMDKMITGARESGVLFAVSAGNSGHHLDGALPLTFVDHPDIGMVGSPSLNKDTISVASVENVKMQRNFIKYGEDKTAAYSPAGPTDPIKAFEGKDVEFVDVTSGDPSEYPEDVKGKIVLAVRGGKLPNFTDKIEAAQNAGAIGIIVRNHETGGEGLINMAYPEGCTIPAIFIGHKAGTELLALETKTVSFPEGIVGIDNPDAEKISEFSSWGTTPTLDMKPEITAPGGQIYSTYNGDSYGTMSGTSMAAPHVAGGTALVLEYINRNFEGLTNEEKTAFAKRLLMNTAEPILEKELSQYASSDKINEYSPRLQGAGLMRVDKAVRTPVTVVNSTNNEAKVELRDFTNPVITMNLIAHNHTDKAVKYSINTKVLTNDSFYDYFNTLNCIEVEGAIVSGDSEITVPANDAKEFKVTIDLSNADIYENVFVEGFIYLEPEQEADGEGEETNYPQLVVPYVGFYGDWAGENAPRVLDADRFDDDSAWEVAGMLGNENNYLGFDAKLGYKGWQDRVAISPENEDEEAYRNIMPVLTFMRNAEKAEFNILNERGRVVKKLYTDEWIRKTYAKNPMYYTNRTLWDGTSNGNVVEDGKYYYQVKVKPQYKNAVWQEWKVPVTVDTVAPEITEIKYDESTKKLTWKAEDEGTGINYFTFYKIVKDDRDRLVNEEVELLIPSNENGEYEIDLTPYGSFVNFVVVAHDYAENTSEAIGYPTATKFKLENPEPFSLFDENLVLVSGIAAGYREVVATITQDGMEAVEVTIPVNQTTGAFNKIVELDNDGIFRINIAVVDNDGNKTEDVVPNRIFYVDTTPPEILDATSTVIKSSYIDELSAEEVLNSSILLGGGRTVIFIEEGIGYAYDRNFLEGDILERFNNAEEKYVKLANGIFIDKAGKVTKDLPAVKYFEDMLYATIRLEVQENFGEFEVYANGQYMGTYGGMDLLNPKEFNDWIEFELELLPGVKTVEVEVIDTSGYKDTIIIELDIDNIEDEDEKINEIKAIKDFAAIGKEFELPTEVNAILSNGSTKKVPVIWTAPEGIEITEGKVSIGKVGEYIFTGTVDEKYYGGYEGAKLILTVQPSDKKALGAKIEEAEKLDESNYTEESWNALQEALTAAKAVLENKDATQEEVDAALAVLIEAIEGLEIDKSVLQAKVDEAKGLKEEDYMPSLWSPLQEAITAAEEVLGKEDPTVEEVKEALNNLENAINNLKLNPVLGAVEAKYGEIKGENDSTVYLAYILLNLKDEYKEEQIIVKVNDKEILEKKEGKDDYEFRFEGMLEDEPTKVVLIIGEEEFDITELVNWEKTNVSNSDVFAEMIETFMNLQNK